MSADDPQIGPWCLFEWRDGWGHHLCHLRLDHEGDHRCECDQTERRR